MADQVSKDDAAKDRIIRHMNADHQTSLSYYLQHYCSLSSRAAFKPHLRAITFDSITLQSSDGKYHTIPINPSMKSWSEARQRTVDMDREARTALGISHVQVTEYERPRRAPHVIVFGLCIFTFATFAALPWIVPGTFFYDKIIRYFPGGPEVFLWINRKITLLVVAIHCFEVYMLNKTRLRRHGVERGSALWWKWIASCCIEGFGCFQRFDVMVKKKALEMEKVKH